MAETGTTTTHNPGAGSPSGQNAPGYDAVLDRLNARINLEKTRPSRIDPERAFKLDRMRALAAALGAPERDSRFVHVAGSKGKGSTVEMLASCLSACRYAVGVYSSPHLVTPRERIRISGAMIPETAFALHVDRAINASEKLPKDLGPATYFELMTAAAFLYFAEQAVDIAVLEVGLGGRLDSTNIVTPEVCLLTPIQREHTEILGDTLEEIAAEKAGIMKRGVPAITVPQPESVLEVFRAKAEEVGAQLRVLGQDIDYSERFESSPELGPHMRVSVSTPRCVYEHLPVPLKGQHQAANCGLALAALDALRERGFEAPERDVALGLASTPDTGRLEIAWDRPRIILDGAHTPESVEAAMRAIGAHMRYDSMVCVFGCAADKDMAGMLEKVAIGADKIIFTKAASNPRACDPEELQRRFGHQAGKMTQAVPTLKEALNRAAQAVGRDDLIVVTGSFYLVGEAKALLMEAARKRDGR